MRKTKPLTHDDRATSGKSASIGGRSVSQGFANDSQSLLNGCAQCGKQKRVMLDMTPGARARELPSGVIIAAGAAWKICARCWLDGVQLKVQPDDASGAK